MFAVIRKAVTAVLSKDKLHMEKSDDTMLAKLCETEATLLDSIRKKDREVSELRGLRDSFQYKVTKVDKLIKATDKADAIEDLQALRRSAQKLSNSYNAAHTKEKAALDYLQETLNEVTQAKADLISLQEKSHLDEALERFDIHAHKPHTDVMNEVDKREISLVVHTANALVELKTGSR